MPVESAPALRGGLIHFPNGQPLTVNREIPWLEAILTACSRLTYYMHVVVVIPSRSLLVGGEEHGGFLNCQHEPRFVVGVKW
jgi:hypothetical protein